MFHWAPEWHLQPVRIDLLCSSLVYLTWSACCLWSPLLGWPGKFQKLSGNWNPRPWSFPLPNAVVAVLWYGWPFQRRDLLRSRCRLTQLCEGRWLMPFSILWRAFSPALVLGESGCQMNSWVRWVMWIVIPSEKGAGLLMTLLCCSPLIWVCWT